MNVKGVPLFLVSDDAKEFLSKLVQGFADALGIRRITTKPYNPRGNAICESVHRFLGQCLTRLSLEERVTWDTRVNEFSFAHDTAFHDSLGCTPFEVGHGSLARTLTSSMILSDSDSKFSTTSDVKGFYGRLKIAAKEYTILPELRPKVFKLSKMLDSMVLLLCDPIVSGTEFVSIFLLVLSIRTGR